VIVNLAVENAIVHAEHAYRQSTNSARGAMVLALKYRYAAIAPTGRGENARRSKATRVA
jgi:hypothetical protein